MTPWTAHPVAMAVVCRWWSLVYAALFLAAAFDPNAVLPQLDLPAWDVFFLLAAAACVWIALEPHRPMARYLGVLFAVSACLTRAGTIAILIPHPPWVGVASWATLGMTFAVTVALSWWVVEHAPTNGGRPGP